MMDEKYSSMYRQNWTEVSLGSLWINKFITENESSAVALEELGDEKTKHPCRDQDIA